MLKKCTKQLRGCLDSTFPYSKSIEFETDKINYIMSSEIHLTLHECSSSPHYADLNLVGTS